MNKKLLFFVLVSTFVSFLSVGQIRRFEAGSIIIDMGGNAVPGNNANVTDNNSLKPYGLIYKIINDYKTPVVWCINPNKTKDAADFVYNGVGYRGGAFVIPAEYVNATVEGVCASWAASYPGLKYLKTTKYFYANEFAEMNTVPLWGINVQNSAITLGYLGQAGIPNGPGTPNVITANSDLNECYDAYMVAHSDPENDSHTSLYRYLQPTAEGGYSGWIWAGCHGVSWLEHMDPLIPTKFATYVNNGNMSNWNFAPNIGSYTDRTGAYRVAGETSNQIDVAFDATLPVGHVLYFYVKNTGLTATSLTIQSSSDINSGASFTNTGTVTIPALIRSYAFQKVDALGTGGTLITIALTAAADGIRIKSNGDLVSIDAVGYAAVVTPFRFLSEAGLVWHGGPDHSDGTPPYVTRFPTQPFMQFMGTTDGAHVGGSEQIFVPEANTSWRSSTLPAVVDETYINTVPNPDVNYTGLPLQRLPAVLSFGRAFGLPQWGGVMYEAGHILDNGTIPENVAAVRAYLNFSLLATVDDQKTLDNTTQIPTVYSVGNGTPIYANAPGGTNYQWSCECNGVLEPSSRFTPNANSQSVIYTPSPGLVAPGGQPIKCNLKVVIDDICGRSYAFPTEITIYNNAPDPPVAIDDAATFFDFEIKKVDFLSNDYDPNLLAFDYTIGTTSTSGMAGTWTDNADGTVTFVPTTPPAPGYGSYTASRTYEICRPPATYPDVDNCDQATITITVLENPCPITPTYQVPTLKPAYALSSLSGTTWTNPTRATGAPNLSYALCNGNNGQLNLGLDLGLHPTVVPAGTQISIYYRTGATAGSGLRISSSANGGTTMSAVTNYSGIAANSTITYTYTLPAGGANYLRIVGNSNVEYIDAISYLVYRCADAAPIALDDEITMPLNSPPVTVYFDDLVTHPDNDENWTSGFSILVSPLYGTLGTFNPTLRTITYTPNTGFTGIDYFLYQICDNNGDCASATITPLVLAPPVGIDDVHYTKKNYAITGNVSTNDFTFANTTYAISSAGDGTNPPIPMSLAGITFVTTNGASVTISPNGTYTYVPATGYTGEDSFEYTICDELNICNTARVVITVNDLVLTDNPPYATNDNTFVYKNAAITINVLANDYDLDGDINTTSYPKFWVSGAEVVSSSITTANGATVVKNVDGTFTYTPPLNYVGDDYFEYRICDLNGTVQCDVARVTLHVTDKLNTILNDLPNAVDDYYATINVNPITGVNILDNDFDIEEAGLSVVSVDGKAVNNTGITNIFTAHGVVTIKKDGTFEFLPNAYFIGTEVFIYEVTDGVNIVDATVYIQIEFTCVAGDVDNDGVDNCTDLDNDNDGITDVEEGGIAFDTDRDGIPNSLDLDSDNDGMSDITEAGGNDPDGNGIVGTGAVPNNGVNANGIPNDANGGLGYTVADTDNDDLKNPYDIDTDNDGIVDVIEGQHTFAYVAPLNLDANTNGIDDAFDPALGGLFVIPINYDGDSTPDYLDLDTDEDAAKISGGTDTEEAYPTGAPNIADLLADSDADGLLDLYDLYDATLAPPGGVTGTNSTNANFAQPSGQTALNPFPIGVATSNSGPEPDWRDDKIIKWTGTGWENGQGTNGHPGLLDGSYSVYILNEIAGNAATIGHLEESAVINNLVFLNDVGGNPHSLDINALVTTGFPGTGACLTVLGAVINQGKVRMLAKSDSEFGQYLGPSLSDAVFQMQLEEGWHNLAFPMSNATASTFDADNNPNVVSLTGVENTHNLWWYDSEESCGEEHGFFKPNTLAGYKSHAYGTWKMVPGSQLLSTYGYNFYLGIYNSSILPYVISISGATNDRDKEFATHNNWGGWNLIPNIYPVTLDVELFDGQGGLFDPNNDGIYDFDRAVWIWNPNDTYVNPYPGVFGTGAYVAYDVELNQAVDVELVQTPAKIAPMQSFYIRRINASEVRRNNAGSSSPGGVNPGVAAGVKVDDALDDIAAPGGNWGSTINVLMKESYRSACNTTPHYKTNGIADVILVAIKDAGKPELNDATELAFADHYTNELDRGLDISKISSGGEGAPTLFSILGDKALVINKMAYPEINTKVPLGFYAEEDEKDYEFVALQLPDGWSVYLEDRLTGSWHTLSSGPYYFKNNLNFRIDRFVLHFNKSGDEIKPIYPEAIAWGTQEGIEIAMNNLRSLEAEVLVTNLMGQVIHHSTNVDTRENYQIPLNDKEPQVYLVTVITNELTTTQKVVR